MEIGSQLQELQDFIKIFETKIKVLGVLSRTTFNVQIEFLLYLKLLYGTKT